MKVHKKFDINKKYKNALRQYEPNLVAKFLSNKKVALLFLHRRSRWSFFCVIKRIRSAYRKPVSLCLDVGGRGGEHVLRVQRERLKVDPQFADARGISTGNMNIY